MLSGISAQLDMEPENKTCKEKSCLTAEDSRLFQYKAVLTQWLSSVNFCYGSYASYSKTVLGWGAKELARILQKLEFDIFIC